MSRRRQRHSSSALRAGALVLLAATFSAVTTLGPFAAAAEAAAGAAAGAAAVAGPLVGNDISWPQCPTAQGGFGLPLPATSTGFVVLGLTDGRPFTRNPCFSDQLAWAQAHSIPASAYTMSGYPTADQLTRYADEGPWSTRTLAGQLSNVGYAEAVDIRAELVAESWTAQHVWVDVEPLSKQPWSTSTTAQRANRFVLEGLQRGLHDGGLSYGIYSNRTGWATITATWRLPAVPAWATAGPQTSSSPALALCAVPGVSAGRVYLAQWWDSTYDHDLTCSPYAFGDLPPPTSALSGSTGEFTGDWNNDVLARVRASGDLMLYAGNGRGQIGSATRVGTGWTGFDQLETAGDLNGDGALDVLARQAGTGDLWLYPGNGAGGWKARIRVGTGWTGMSHIVGPGDFNGDQRADVLAVQRSTGYLWLYPGNGRAGWLPPVRVGGGWTGYDALVGPGDVNGDGTADLVAREKATGRLWLYPGNGRGGWLPRVQIGSGWGGMTAIMSPGDLNGDRVPDIVARDASGALWLYPRGSQGGWLSRSQIGSGWNGVDAIF
jgi:FG-GAP-like repeat